MTTKEKKYCVICKEIILEDKEKWVRLTDFDCGKQTGEVFNHLQCWKERFQITNSERKKVMYSQVSKGLGNIKDRLNGGGMAIAQ